MLDARGRGAQGGERGGDRRDPRRPGCRDGLDDARRPGVRRVDRDAGVRQGGEREPGQRRHPEPRADQPEHGQVVVGGEVHPGREPGARARAHELRAALRAARDPRAVRERAERHRLPGPAAVGGGQHHEDVVVQQRHPEQAAALPVVRRRGVRGAERQGDVDPAGGELGERLGRLRLGERRAQAGVLGTERGERGGQQGGGARGERRDAHAPGPQRRHGRDLLQRGVERRLHGGGVPGEHQAGLRQAHATPRADDDRRADRPLHRPELLAGGGLRQPEGARGGGHAAGVVHRADEAEGGGVERSRRHPRIISRAHGYGRNWRLSA